MVIETKSKVIEFPISLTLVKEYQLRRAGKATVTIEVSVPQDFIKRLVHESGLTHEEFIDKCRVSVYYGGGDELLYKFELKEKEQTP